jgi:mono/diheme cytochrome c family protein
MNRRNVRFILPLLALLAVVTAAYAGGWAIITLNDLPDYAVAGKPLNLTFAVRQHGVTLLPDLKPSVRATNATGLTVKTAVVRTAKPGEYSAALTLPQAGEWTIAINSGFNSSATTLPVLKVISPESPLPTPFSPNTRGARLFTAKGCVGCHRHGEINPERTSDAKFDLTAKRFPEDYLKKFLADPSIKPAEMPNLNLKQDEITAFVAFINKSVLKTSQVRTNQ